MVFETSRFRYETIRYETSCTYLYQERQPKLSSQTDKVQNIRGRMENTHQTVVAGEASESDEDDSPSQTSKVLKIQNYFILAL